MRTEIIACATLIEEMQPLLTPDMAYEELDFGLQMTPNNLRKIHHQVIDDQCTEIDTFALDYGFEVGDTVIRKLLFSPWNSETLKAPPGHTIEYLDFKTNIAKVGKVYSFQSKFTF